jgi:hypothetical protein
MTKRSILSVRLDPELAGLLERHCAATGATRSQVVKQSVAEYLVATSGPTLSALAEAALPPLPRRAAQPRPRPARQKRFRDYVREKRRR